MQKKMLPLFLLFLACIGLLAYLIIDPAAPANKPSSFNQLTNTEFINLSNVSGSLPDRDKFTVYFNSSTIKNVKDGQKIKNWLSDTDGPVLSLDVITAKNEPVYKSNSKDGHAGVYFDGQSYFEAWNIIGNKIINSDNLTAIAVFKPDDSTKKLQDLTEIFGWGNCNNNRFFAHLSSDMINFHFGDPNNRVDSNKISLIPNHYNILVLERRGKIASIELNSAKVGQTETTAALDTTLSASLMVGTSSCGHNFKGEIAELSILKNLSTSEKNSFVKKIMTDYKLAF